MDTQQPVAVPTSTAHPAIERASAHLAAVLVGNGDVDAVLTASEVILRLADVIPPLLPLEYPSTGPTEGADIREAITAAIADLRTVVDDNAPTAAVGEPVPGAAGEALRAAHGVRSLLELLERIAAAATRR